jgi:hypothetical protein
MDIKTCRKLIAATAYTDKELIMSNGETEDRKQKGFRLPDIGKGLRDFIATERKKFNLPKRPSFDAATDAQLRRALIARIRLASIRGGGRRDTIATSAGGVTARAPIARRTLTGA